MPYATQADIEARYPGELAQAGPRDAANDLDSAAIARALLAASEAMDRALLTLGWPVPLPAPAPDWVITLVVDLGLYLATPTVLASQADFSDRRARYQAALATLDAIARGELIPVRPANLESVTTVYAASRPRVYGRGAL